MAAFAGMLNYSLLLALHFLAVVPLHTARSLWIATKLKLHPDVVSELSCYDAVDLKKVVKNMEEPVVADRSCGHCGSIQGTFEQGAFKAHSNKAQQHAFLVETDRGLQRCSILYATCM